jgi:hypothetical protein
MLKWQWPIVRRKESKKRDFLDVKQELAKVVEEIFGMDPAANLTIRQIIFDTKYKGDMVPGEAKTPSELVVQFGSLADKGDNTYLRHYFYRVLRRNHDPVVRRLKYRLKRNS